MPTRKETLRVRLTNRWATFLCSPEEQACLKKRFRYRKPGAEFSEAFRSKVWDGFINLMQRGRVATGLFLEERKRLEKDYHLLIDDRRVRPSLREIPFDATVRPYQREAVQAMLAASSCGGLILVATGAGKTFLTAELFRRLVGQACFVVDELSLLEQSRIAMERILHEKIGVVGRGEFHPQRITIATVQTLHRHRSRTNFLAWFRKLDMLVIDEVHLAMNRRNFDVVRLAHPPAVFGLTATLRIEKPHIHLPAVALAGPVIFRYPIVQGVEEGFLSRGVVGRLRFDDPLQGVSPGYQTAGDGHIQAGSRPADYRRRIVLNAQRNDLIERLTREGIRRGRATVVLVEQVLHLKLLSRRMSDIPHRVACGALAVEDRTRARLEMDSGKLRLILANRVFGKGVDIRAVNLIIDGAALSGRDGALQRYGRGARLFEGKHELMYVDVCDAGNRYENAAWARRKAWREIGCPVVDLWWQGEAVGILDRLEKEITQKRERKDNEH